MKTDLTLLRARVESVRARSAWDKGVKTFAIDLLDKYDDLCLYYEQEGRECPAFCLSTVLDGCKDWEQYCYWGKALIYDGDIARSLCTPSELYRNDYGIKSPNGTELWMDVQVRAYYQAWNLISRYM